MATLLHHRTCIVYFVIQIVVQLNLMVLQSAAQVRAAVRLRYAKAVI
ncbi:hypothetical protein FHW71_004070 [Enterobacter sp. Sphag1F]|nr:hypothetical protein [Enterobacter sp. Sphag1F]